MGDLTQLGQFVVNGLVVGSILSLTAVGLTLVYGILRLANFAHGDLVTLGAYLALFVAALSSPTASVTWAATLAMLLAALPVVDRTVRPLLARRLGHIRGLQTPILSPAESFVLLYVAALLAILVAATLAPPGGRSWAWGLCLGAVVLAAAAAALRRSARRSIVIGALAAAGLLAAYAAGGRLLLGVAVAVALVAILSVALDLAVWRVMRRRRAGLVTLIILSIGIALVLRNSVILEWGERIRGFPGTVTRAQPILGTGVSATVNEMWTVGVALVVVLLLHLLLKYSQVGRGMRALADNLELARVTGMDVDRVILYVWAIAGALAALSGVLLGLNRPIHPNLGWFTLLPIFAAVILGGIGSPYGAMAGGLVIGLAMETSSFFGVPVAYKMAVAFGLLILVLLVRPQGIFSGRSTA